MWNPQNDLERAFQDAHLGLPETVAYFRELKIQAQFLTHG